MLVCATASFALLSFSGSVFAQSHKSLAPVSEWDVLDIVDNGYCAASREYEENVIVTLARNPARETSVAIDYQRPVLDPARSLSVTFDTGFSQNTREFSLNPASPQAIVARFSHDEPFFNALQATDILRADIGGQAYHFDLTNVAATGAKLESCVQGLEGGGVSAVPAPVSAEEFVDAAPVSALGDDPLIHRLSVDTQNEIVSLKDETPSLKAQESTSAEDRREIDLLRQEIAALKAAQVSVSDPAPVFDPELELLKQKVQMLTLTSDNCTLQIFYV